MRDASPAASSASPKAAKALNMRAAAAVGLCNLAHFYSICSIFSYAGFLAVDCGWAENEWLERRTPPSSRAGATHVAARA